MKSYFNIFLNASLKIKMNESLDSITKEKQTTLGHIHFLSVNEQLTLALIYEVANESLK